MPNSDEVQYLITHNWKLLLHFVSRESKSPCCKADWERGGVGGVNVHSAFLYHNHYERSIKHCLYAAKPQWLLLHQSSFATWICSFQIYSSQGQGDNNSYTLIIPNYLFLPPSLNFQPPLFAIWVSHNLLLPCPSSSPVSLWRKQLWLFWIFTT